MKKYTLLFLIISLQGVAQSQVPLITAVPLLHYAPDARAGALGDAGIATSPDSHSIYWNTAKLVFVPGRFGVSVDYAPWSNINNFYIADMSLYWKIDSDNAITASFKYFREGTIVYTNANGVIAQYVYPHDYTFHAGYSRKICRHLALGINLGIVKSDPFDGLYPLNSTLVNNIVSPLADFSLYYTHPVKGNSVFKKYNLGLTVSNIGGRMNYTTDDNLQELLPANLGLGSSFDFQFGKDHSLSFAFDMNKLLVPPPDTSGIAPGYYPNTSVLKAALQSFSNVSGGISGELKTFTYSAGVEYWFRKLFSLRCGYFNENEIYGENGHLSLGAGARFRFLQLDFSYLIPETPNRIIINNIYKLSLTFEL